MLYPANNPKEKQFRALMLGPLYNKSFKGKIKALEEALKDLQDHISHLNHARLAETSASVHRVEMTSDGVDSTTRATLDQVHSLRSDFRESQGNLGRRIDDSNEIKRAVEEARKAMLIVLEERIKNAECKFFPPNHNPDPKVV